jgi:hypothetical protein
MQKSGRNLKKTLLTSGGTGPGKTATLLVILTYSTSFKHPIFRSLRSRWQHFFLQKVFNTKADILHLRPLEKHINCINFNTHTGITVTTTVTITVTTTVTNCRLSPPLSPAFSPSSPHVTVLVVTVVTVLVVTVMTRTVMTW